MSIYAIETWILIILATVSAWFVNQRKPQVLMVMHCEEHVLDSIMVKNKIFKSNYYCPKTCKVQHAHMAHEDTEECNPCNHWTFDLNQIIRRSDEK